MLLFTRPPEPPQFAKRVAKSKQAVRQYIDATIKAAEQPHVGAHPTPADSAEPEPPASRKKREVFPPKWSDFKDVFSKAQRGKCAYCEASVIGAQHGDVEHYYPKARVDKLLDDPATWGREKPYLSNVEGRKPEPACKFGYWWLAYEWSNYLLSCMVCNEYWKGAIFPVEDDPRRLPPVSDVAEVALLLNPFENIAPAEHLAFDYYGQIHPVADSRRGFETIRTCGLDRPSLCNLRRDIAREAYYLTDRLITAETPEQLKDALYSLYLKGAETNHHPGMVRIIVEHCSRGLTWSEIVEQLARLLATDLREATEPDEIRDALSKIYEIGDDGREHSELVRAVVAEQCGKAWETIVGELASSLMNLFKTSSDVLMRASALRNLHEMGAEGRSYSASIRIMVALESGMSWGELEAELALAATTYSLKRLDF